MERRKTVRFRWMETGLGRQRVNERRQEERGRSQGATRFPLGVRGFPPGARCLITSPQLLEAAGLEAEHRAPHFGAHRSRHGAWWRGQGQLVVGTLHRHLTGARVGQAVQFIEQIDGPARCRPCRFRGALARRERRRAWRGRGLVDGLLLPIEARAGARGTPRRGDSSRFGGPVSYG